MKALKLIGVFALIAVSLVCTVILTTNYSNQCGATPFNTFFYEQKKLIFAITGDC